MNQNCIMHTFKMLHLNERILQVESYIICYTFMGEERGIVQNTIIDKELDDSFKGEFHPSSSPSPRLQDV